LVGSASAVVEHARHPDTDMIHAFNHPIFVDEFEIGVVDTSDGPIIIHAMTARPKYLR
jgi:hypothetical protein